MGQTKIRKNGPQAPILSLSHQSHGRIREDYIGQYGKKAERHKSQQTGVTTKGWIQERLSTPFLFRSSFWRSASSGVTSASRLSRSASEYVDTAPPDPGGRGRVLAAANIFWTPREFFISNSAAAERDLAVLVGTSFLGLGTAT